MILDYPLSPYLFILYTLTIINRYERSYSLPKSILHRYTAWQRHSFSKGRFRFIPKKIHVFFLFYIIPYWVIYLGASFILWILILQPFVDIWQVWGLPTLYLTSPDLSPKKQIWFSFCKENISILIMNHSTNFLIYNQFFLWSRIQSHLIPSIYYLISIKLDK